MFKTKKCVKCTKDKSIEEFSKDIRNRDGLRSYCKKCTKGYNKKYKAYERKHNPKYKKYQTKYRNNNKEKLSTNNKEYRKKNKEKIKIKRRLTTTKNRKEINTKMRIYRKNNRERIKILQHKSYCKNKKKVIEKSKIYQSNNKEKIRKRNNKRYKNEPLFKLKKAIRNSIGSSFRKRKFRKTSKTVNILGCAFDDFKIYIQNLFDANMNWDNYGTYWVLDHIEPLSRGRNYGEIVALNHYTNIQPLEKITNILKKDFYIEHKNSIIKYFEW